MNRKQFVVLLVVGLALGGVGLYLSKMRSASFTSTERTEAVRLLADFPVNDIAWITVRQRSNEVNLVKGDVWTVRERSDYPASVGDIVEFARKLWDVRPAQSQKIGPSQLGRLELLAPDAATTNAGTLVELKGKDGKRIRSLLLGKQSLRGGGGDPMGGGGWPNGRWVYLPDEPGTAYLISEPFSGIEPKPERWLKKDFFRVEKASSIAVDFPEATNSWKLTRESETAEWKLADPKAGEELDSGKVAGVSNPLSTPAFMDVMPGEKLEAGGSQPVVLKIDTFDHFTYTVKVGLKTNENHFMTVAVAAQLQKERIPGKDEKPDDKAKLDKEFKDQLQKLEEKLKLEQSLEKWTWLVAGWTVEPLMQPRSQLMAEKPGTNAVNKVEFPGMGHPPMPPAGANAGGL